MKYYVEFIKDGSNPSVLVWVEGDDSLSIPRTKAELAPDVTEEEIKDAGYKLLDERKAAILKAQEDVSAEVAKLNALEAKVSKENDVTDQELADWKNLPKTRVGLAKEPSL